MNIFRIAQRTSVFIFTTSFCFTPALYAERAFCSRAFYANDCFENTAGETMKNFPTDAPNIRKHLGSMLKKIKDLKNRALSLGSTTFTDFDKEMMDYMGELQKIQSQLFERYKTIVDTDHDLEESYKETIENVEFWITELFIIRDDFEELYNKHQQAKKSGKTGLTPRNIALLQTKIANRIGNKFTLKTLRDKYDSMGLIDQLREFTALLERFLAG